MKLPGNIILADSVTCPRTNEASSDDNDCDIDIWDKKLPAYIFRKLEAKVQKKWYQFSRRHEVSQISERRCDFQNDNAYLFPIKIVMLIRYQTLLLLY